MQQLGRITPDEREAMRLGRQGFERGDVGVGIRELNRLLRTRPRYADAHYMVGMLHEKNGDLESARLSLEQALRINAGYAEARLALASIYERSGHFDRSRTLSTEDRRAAGGAVGLDSTTRGKLANIQAALGDALREAGEHRDAIDAYRRALDRCPEYHDIRHRLGIALREAGLPHQAISAFLRVLRANRFYHASAVQLALTYYTLGRSDEALKAWEAVLERDPSRDDARMYLRLVRGAMEESDAAPIERPLGES